MSIDRAEINKRFGYHPPATKDEVNIHEEIRNRCATLADFIRTSQPPSREQSSALTKLEEAMFWANAGVARNLSYPGNLHAGTTYPAGPPSSER